jgi:ribosomal protein S16
MTGCSNTHFYGSHSSEARRRRDDPVYRIVSGRWTQSRDGKFVEEIGTYNPKGRGQQLHLESRPGPSMLGSASEPSPGLGRPVASFIKKSSKLAAVAAWPEAGDRQEPGDPEARCLPSIRIQGVLPRFRTAFFNCSHAGFP